MRISDWSSDVCSSDLADIVLALDIAVGGDVIDRAAAAGRRDRDARRELVGQRPRDRGLRLFEIEIADADLGLALEFEGRLVGRDVDRAGGRVLAVKRDRKSTRLNSSH